MRTKPEEYIGKWVSNLGGLPDNWQFIISASKVSDPKVIRTRYLELTPNGKVSDKEQLLVIKYIGEPIEGSMYVSKHNKKLIKAIFRHF